jgi:hypothetical protein
LAINPEPLIPQNPPREGIPPLEIPIEIKDDLFGADCGRTLNSHLHKRPSSEYNSNPLKKGSLRKCPYSHIGHWDEFKDGMSSDAIEGELSHLEAIPILFPSMPILDVLFGPIFQPILDPNYPSYALSPKSLDDPRNPLRQLKHRSHEGHKEDQEEQQQWLKDIKNLCDVAIEWMDDVLNKINLRVTNPWEILDNKESNKCHKHGMMETMLSPMDIHEESTLKLKKEDNIDEHGSYFMNTSSNPCLHGNLLN